MKSYLTLSCILFSFAVITGCQKDDDLTTTDGSTTNSWIYSEMKNNYLWLDEIKDYKNYNEGDSPEEFFNSLISSNEKKNKNGQTYWYSYMEKRYGVSKVSEYAENTYGMEYAFYSIKGRTGYFARILYVLPNSPAKKAGVKRGMWVKKINNQSITAENRSLLSGGNGVTLSVYEGQYTSGDELTGEIKVGPEVAMYENPFLKDTVLIGENGIKIGYLAYNHFSTGPTGYEDKAYDRQMASIFQHFKGADVKEFILDLRYNPGGYLDCALLLSSYLVPSSSLKNVFCEVNYNSKSIFRAKTYSFKDTVQSNLNLERVYILTGEWTASASEAVINGLKPMMDVVQVGDTTEGKNLGSVAIKNDKYEWILHPIVAKIANAKGEGDYWTGIIPTPGCVFEELRNGASLGELGTPDDHMVKIALKHMGAVSEDAISTKTNSIEYIHDFNLSSSSLKRKSISSIRIN